MKRMQVVPSVWVAALCVALAGTGGTSAAEPPPRPAFQDGKAAFSLKVKGETIPYEIFGLSLLPDETVSLGVEGRSPGDRFTLEGPGGRQRELPPEGLSWQAPAESGLYRLRVAREGSDDAIVLNVFVLVPIERVRDEKLNGYRIGSYPSTPLKGLAIYKPPRGFIEVTRENQDTPVSPHFRLGQFLCKQDGGPPRYLVLKERLVLKLELILQKLNAAGYRCDTLHVMSGYRTPFYNAAIGNVRYSRHVWGGAADVFVDDSPKDGMMDDLNGDGAIDWRDAAVVYELIDGLFGLPSYKPYLGGLGRYKKTAAHGPFVHVDVRGFRARWGT